MLLASQRYWLSHFLPTGIVSRSELIVFRVRQSTPRSAVLQSRVHEVWARFFGSTMKDDSATRLPTASRRFPSRGTSRRTRRSKRRASVLRVPRRPDGDEQRGADQDLQPLPRPRRDARPTSSKLRELHAAMDRAVLDAYGWTDLQPHLRVPARLRGGRRRRGRRRQAAAARSPGATAGPTTSATKSSPASSNSTPPAPKKNASPAFKRRPSPAESLHGKPGAK